MLLDIVNKYIVGSIFQGLKQVVSSNTEALSSRMLNARIYYSRRTKNTSKASELSDQNPYELSSQGVWLSV